ncbi:arylsulfatase [Pseudomonas sp. LS44]|uniref:arylsulfatase n=1 Tax=Pseudomonas sp. LS44 TaxID=1357074 RepID=UPI00215AC13B|nr:arylsulfatase [Pseudomonas sp. LS44]UVE16024.1 arylsulfatase [Pseudomonas sp. LS44]
MTYIGKKLARLVLAIGLSSAALSAFAAEKPNVLVIFGDDVGIFNLSAYNQGMMGYETPNIDRIAKEGALFTHGYGEQSCTAGRSAFALGQHPFRTGLLTVGMPGSEHGIPDWAPTIGDVMKQQGYTTGQFGKNHLGDRNQHLPTNHGFDEFFGNLYHMNAEEEPETYYYPKDPEFRKKYGPRGVIHSYADGKIEDTGPLTRKRMETIDDELVQATENFIDKANKADKPFFVWFNSTRMHVWTHLKKEYDGKTGIGLYPDGMVEHDDHVGKLLKKLDDLGIADNTIIIYTTDNGAEKFTWPDGGTSPFHGEKGTSNEGGHRVPLLVKWPGVIKPGSRFNNMIAHNDWMPTLAAAAGNASLVADMAKGSQLSGKQYRVHLDGYNFLPFFKGEAKDSPREEYFYFSMGGDLDAIRWKEWRLSFATMEGGFGDASRRVANVPVLTNLLADPFQTARQESDMARRWAFDQAWLFVPIQAKVKAFMGSLSQYPFQEGVSLNVANINYQSLAVKKAMMSLQKAPPAKPAQ